MFLTVIYSHIQATAVFVLHYFYHNKRQFMSKHFLLFLLSVFVSVQLKSQTILPKEGSVLNYRLIGFTISPVLQTDVYEIEIAAGNYASESSFKKHVVITEKGKTNRILARVPAFGAEYTWRVIYKGADAKTMQLHHFSTATVPYVDTANTRLRVVKNAEKYKDAYVFLDGNKALYDMDGSAVWFLPQIPGVVEAGSVVRDLKHTPQGTITFMTGSQGDFMACEINYNGEVLWKCPNNGKVSGNGVEDYHHQFTRLLSGHYMVLGNEWTDVFLKVSRKKDSSLLIGAVVDKPSDSVVKIDKKPFGTLIEYDESGAVAWSYKSSGYFNGSDLINHRDANGKIDVNVHDNAFFFDDKTQTAYISFKDISRVIKLKYPEGKVMNTYGKIYKKGSPDNGNKLFCDQHCCRISEKGYLYLFNNNSCNAGSMPKITMMQEPATAGDTLKKIWEYECNYDGLTEKEKQNKAQPLGGSVLELGDLSMLACMGSVHSKVFIVNQDKKVLWSAVPEMWDKNTHEWIVLPQYRADIITDRQDIDRLIWGN